jgi:hypothetical protein
LGGRLSRQFTLLVAPAKAGAYLPYRSEVTVMGRRRIRLNKGFALVGELI